MTADATPPPVVIPACRCGHPRDDHHRGRLVCMASTPDETWACDCDEYNPLLDTTTLAYRLEHLDRAMTQLRTDVVDVVLPAINRLVESIDKALAKDRDDHASSSSND